jgi:4a-hydroxytetrahydrobiopterin dehydratase
VDDDTRATRQQISDAVGPAGWRLILGAIYSQVQTAALAEAAEASSLSVSAVAADGQGHLTVDIRAERAVLRLQSADTGGVTGHDIRPAHEISRSLTDLSDGLIDPLGREAAIWFQQMDAPRPQRNRIHVDIDVPHEATGARIGAALAAGGALLSDRRAPAYWVLADPEGNEACVGTWQGRD